MKPHHNKLSLSSINKKVRMPFLVIHYSRQRKRARIDRLDGEGYYHGYYLGTPDYVEKWDGSAIEWILLASLHGND